MMTMMIMTMTMMKILQMKTVKKEILTEVTDLMGKMDLIGKTDPTVMILMVRMVKMGLMVKTVMILVGKMDLTVKILQTELEKNLQIMEKE